jgi:hypothetical protein
MPQSLEMFMLKQKQVDPKIYMKKKEAQLIIDYLHFKNKAQSEEIEFYKKKIIELEEKYESGRKIFNQQQKKIIELTKKEIICSGPKCKATKKPLSAFMKNNRQCKWCETCRLWKCETDKRCRDKKRTKNILYELD